MSDVSTNFPGKPAHHLFGFAAGKCCGLCRFLRDGSVKIRRSSGPLLTSNLAQDLKIIISLHWSIFLHFKDVSFLFASEHTT